MSSGNGGAFVLFFERLEDAQLLGRLVGASGLAVQAIELKVWRGKAAG